MISTGLITGVYTYLFYTQYYTIESKSIPYDINITVSNKIGFNLDSDKIHFGRLASNSHAERSIRIENLQKYKVSIKLRADGEFGKNIVLNETPIILEPWNTACLPLPAGVWV